MTPVPFDVEPIPDTTFGAYITNIDLVNIDDETFAALYQTWLEYALLVFPGQHLTNESQVTFAKRFGELEFELAPISNVRKDGSVRDHTVDDDVMKILKGNMGWHADSTYMKVQAKGAVFRADVVPSRGGETGWADMRAAYNALSDEMRDKVTNLSASHSLHYSQKKAGFTPSNDGEYSGYGFHEEEPPRRSLVKIHPETGRPSLLIGRHAYGLPGLSEADSEALLDELIEFACRRPRVYHHTWSPGDAVVWDNRCLLHQACPWDMNEPRVMFHARIKGDPVTEAAQSS